MYKKMYYILFNAITDALKLLETGNIWEVRRRLAAAQCQTEEIFMSWNGDEDDDGEL